MLRALDMIAGSLSAMALILFTYSGLARHLAPAFTADWSDEAVVILLVWAMFLTGYRITLERSHISVDLVLERIKPAHKKALLMFSTLILTIFSAGLMIAGVIVVRDAIILGERTESSAQIPVFIYFAALPVGMALNALAGIRLLLRSEDR